MSKVSESPAEQDVKDLIRVLVRELGGAWAPGSPARSVLVSDWLAERDAQQRREGAAEAPRVEIERVAGQPARCKVWCCGELIFSGRDDSADL